MKFTLSNLVGVTIMAAVGFMVARTALNAVGAGSIARHIPS